MAVATSTEKTALQAAFETNPYQPVISHLSAVLQYPIPDAKNPELQNEMVKAVALFKKVIRENIDRMNEIWPVQKQSASLSESTKNLAQEVQSVHENPESIDPAKMLKIQLMVNSQQELERLKKQNDAINTRMKILNEGCEKTQRFIVALMQENPSVEQRSEFWKWADETFGASTIN